MHDADPGPRVSHRPSREPVDEHTQPEPRPAMSHRSHRPRSIPHRPTLSSRLRGYRLRDQHPRHDLHPTSASTQGRDLGRRSRNARAEDRTSRRITDAENGSADGFAFIREHVRYGPVCESGYET